jgi:hypothetical protein
MQFDERDEYIHNYRAPSGCAFWLFWLAWGLVTYFAFTLGESLGKGVEGLLDAQATSLPRALSLGQPVDAGSSVNPLVSLLGGLVSGGVLGLGQGLVLLPFLKVRAALQWALATTIGRAVGWVALYLLAKDMRGLVLDKNIVGFAFLFLMLGGTALIAGVALGYPQSILLGHRVQHPSWWVLATLGGPLAASLLVSVTVMMEGRNVVRDFSTPMIAAILAVSTAIALTDMLSVATSEAEWVKNLRWRKERRKAPQEDTVLGSSLYGPAQPPQPGVTPPHGTDEPAAQS